MNTIKYYQQNKVQSFKVEGKNVHPDFPLRILKIFLSKYLCVEQMNLFAKEQTATLRRNKGESFGFALRGAIGKE
jgi:hypothetical protein